MTSSFSYTLADIEAELRRRDLEELEAIDTELAERRLAEYIKQAWHQVEPGRHLLWNWHIDCLAEHLEAAYKGDLKKLLINIPPRFAKSLLVCVFWMTWVWMHDPRKRWMFASYSQVFSKRDSLRCRRIIESDWYQARWGKRYQLTGDQNEKLKFENDLTGFRMATSVGGTATGEGGDILVVDDPHKPDEVHSDTTRERVLEWWRETFSSRLNDEKTGVKVVVMQRLHEEDLSGYLLQAEGGWDHVCLPLEHEGGTKRVTSLMPLGYDPRTKEGELLFEKRISAKELPEIKRRSGAYGYAGQYQQRPSPEDGGFFKRAAWNFWRPANAAGIGTTPRPKRCHQRPAVIAPAFDKMVISLDAAFKDLKTSDYVVFTVWGAHLADRYLLDLVREQLSFQRTVQAFKELCVKWPRAFAKLVEDKANGTAVIDTLKSEISGILAIEPKGGKKARAAAIEPQVSSGNVYLPEGAPFLDDFIEECAAFPNAAHDDQVDSMSQALLYLLPGASSLGLYQA